MKASDELKEIYLDACSKGLRGRRMGIFLDIDQMRKIRDIIYRLEEENDKPRTS